MAGDPYAAVQAASSVVSVQGRQALLRQMPPG
jgi:hypothetical protein